jgi:hypothetical protein
MHKEYVLFREDYEKYLEKYNHIDQGFDIFCYLKKNAIKFTYSEALKMREQLLEKYPSIKIEEV